MCKAIYVADQYSLHLFYKTDMNKITYGTRVTHAICDECALLFYHICYRPYTLHLFYKNDMNKITYDTRVTHVIRDECAL